MESRGSEKGITLIALVVTIVVLLILAGITIAFVLSDGGIFQSAKDAKIEQTAAAIRDYVGQINGVVSAKYWSNVASGSETPITLQEESAGEDKSKVGLVDFFPDETYEPHSLYNTGEDNVDGMKPVTCDENGMIKNATFNVYVGENCFGVEIDSNGIVSVRYMGGIPI